MHTEFLGAASEADRSALVHEYGEALAATSIDTIEGELLRTPEKERGRLLRAIFIYSQPGKNTFRLVGMLLEKGEYAAIQDKVNDHLRAYAADPAKQLELADWATTLPELPEAHKIVHRSVEPFFAHDPQEARVWLEKIPADNWTRNYALAEFSQQAVWKRNDSESSWWAIERISDPKLKQTVVQWRGNWKPPSGTPSAKASK